MILAWIEFLVGWIFLIIMICLNNAEKNLCYKAWKELVEDRCAREIARTDVHNKEKC